MERRDFLKSAPVLGTVSPRVLGDRPLARQSGGAAQANSETDYIVVGSGAGGGTVAARLAEAGYSVLVLEAGGDPRSPTAADYDVPGFHAFATENPAMRWDFFVRHYADAAQQRLDPNFLPDEDGVWYPRAGTLGGCTAHNALIFVYPSNSDWDQIADLTGDASWRAPAMWKYFQRLENCKYRASERFWHRLGIDPSRHGWSGWLSTEKAKPDDAIADEQVRRVIAQSVTNALREFGVPPLNRLDDLLDPNDWRTVEHDEIGARYTPLTTDRHQRVGTRERLRAAEKRHPDRLRIELNALATRVVFDDKVRNRAVGVEYLKGDRLYEAHPGPRSAGGETRIAVARREVILAGGAFNTPQLLMLSGIGDPEVLGNCGIPVRVSLPGVGRNLQDRYEVAVVNRMKHQWDMLEGATFKPGDRQYGEWEANREGIYTSNGAVISVVQRSAPGKPVPDLFCYALVSEFRGYRPGYSEVVRKSRDCLTWIVLKAHTNNRGGSVTITSPDPRKRPAINFRYFEEGTDANGDDLQAVVDGIKLVRRMNEGMKPEIMVREEMPGEDVTSDADLKTFVRKHAWGHHASCTCAIGAQAKGGVLTSDFRVHQTERLRVVDASVFPRAPGLFIVSAIYMVGEKAADAIIAAAAPSKK